MTYAAFLVVFLLPPLLLLAGAGRFGAPALPPRAPLHLGAVALLALLWTTPWDNYLVWRGVWSYAPGRVVGTLGYVPLEEYLFFVLQPLLAGLWLYRLPDAADPEAPPAGRGGAALRVAGALLFAALAVLGLLLLRHSRGTYLGLILAWAAPVLAAQWALVAPALRGRGRLVALGVALPTLYLWVADRVAIGLGVWSISPALSSGLSPLGLPVEEAVFFLVTDLLVVLGLAVFEWGGSPAAIRRARPVSPARRAARPAARR